MRLVRPDPAHPNDRGRGVENLDVYDRVSIAANGHHGRGRAESCSPTTGGRS
jgi:hypothetical protein